MPRLSLGLDSSTQSLTALIVDIDDRKVLWQKSLDYRRDPRLNSYGINSEYILPPSEPGQANQPVMMFLASLDAIFSDLKTELPDQGLSIKDIAFINVSGQQHGHVLLDQCAAEDFAALNHKNIDINKNLETHLAGSFSLPFARIWRTSCTAAQAEHVRSAVGGKEKLIRLSGSDAPLRFSAFGIRKTAQDFPNEYKNTLLIHQISSVIPAILTGDVHTGLDYGNACGTSLMHYENKTWSDELVAAVADGLPGGADVLKSKLPQLKSAISIIGTLADYFVRKYGFNSRCTIGVGSGDNPQTKVLVQGSLLSLGTSFVNMVETDGKTYDLNGYANAMYDAFDRPFMFGCRTNGALRWDNVRALHHLEKHDYAPAESALQQKPPGNNNRMFFWQAENESFPVSKAFDPVRIGYDQPDLAADYAGIIESCLASVYLHSKPFMAPGDSLYVAGGSTSSPEIMRRTAAIWNRNVIPIDPGGAALGAAVSGAYALLAAQGNDLDPGQFGASFLKQRPPIAPQPDDVAAYHNDNGFLNKFKQQEKSILKL